MSSSAAVAAVADARKRANEKYGEAKNFVREKITGRTVYLSLFAVILIAHGVFLTIEGGDETTDGNPGLLIFSIIAMVLIGGLFSWGAFNPIDKYDDVVEPEVKAAEQTDGGAPDEAGNKEVGPKGGKNDSQPAEEKKKTKSNFQQLETRISKDLVFAMGVLFLVATFQAAIGIVSGVGPGGKRAVVSTAGYLGIFGAASMFIYGMYKFLSYKGQKGTAKNRDTTEKEEKAAKEAAKEGGTNEENAS